MSNCPICNSPKEEYNATCCASYCQEAHHFYNVARNARKNSRKQKDAYKWAQEAERKAQNVAAHR